MPLDATASRSAVLTRRLTRLAIERCSCWPSRRTTTTNPAYQMLSSRRTRRTARHNCSRSSDAPSTQPSSTGYVCDGTSASGVPAGVQSASDTPNCIRPPLRASVRMAITGSAIEVRLSAAIPRKRHVQPSRQSCPETGSHHTDLSVRPPSTSGRRPEHCHAVRPVPATRSASRARSPRWERCYSCILRPVLVLVITYSPETLLTSLTETTSSMPQSHLSSRTRQYDHRCRSWPPACLLASRNTSVLATARWVPSSSRSSSDRLSAGCCC